MAMPLNAFMRDLLSHNVRPELGCSNVALIVDNAASSPRSSFRKTKFGQEEKRTSSKRSRANNNCNYGKTMDISDHSLNESRWDQVSSAKVKPSNSPNQAPPVAPSRLMSPFVNSGERKSLNKKAANTIQQPERKPSLESPLKHKDSFYCNRQRLTHTIPPPIVTMSAEQLNNAVEQALIICDTARTTFQ